MHSKTMVVINDTPFPLADANGNAVSFIDNAGNVQAHYTYDAFGGTVSQTGAMAADFRFRFSSKYLDDETGLYYYGFRYYAPRLGRWVNRDPVLEHGFISSLFKIKRNIAQIVSYIFVVNEPINKFDYAGLMTDEEACKQELGDNYASGLTICNDGRAVPCVRQDAPRDQRFPKIKKCILKHEEFHVENFQCKPCGVYTPEYPSDEEEDRQECFAYYISYKCLKQAMKEDCGREYDEDLDVEQEGVDDCTYLYARLIKHASKLSRKFCSFFRQFNILKKSLVINP